MRLDTMGRSWRSAFIIAASLSLSMVMSPAAAYEEAPVTDGGTIIGVVTLKGGKPVPRGFNLVTFPDPVYCGRISNGHGFRLLKEFEIGEEHGLKDVVVVLMDVKKGKPFTFPKSHIEARD